MRQKRRMYWRSADEPEMSECKAPRSSPTAATNAKIRRGKRLAPKGFMLNHQNFAFALAPKYTPVAGARRLLRIGIPPRLAQSEALRFCSRCGPLTPPYLSPDAISHPASCSLSPPAFIAAASFSTLTARAPHALAQPRAAPRAHARARATSESVIAPKLCNEKPGAISGRARTDRPRSRSHDCNTTAPAPGREV